MIFENEQAVIELIKQNKVTPQWVNKAREYSSKMRALVYGDNFTDLLNQIEHIEATSKKAEARRKYARPIKDAICKILDPVDNVYSATGGSKEYNIKDQKKKQEFLSHITNVREGKSLEQWLHTYWAKDLYNIDPSGLMMLEWEPEKTYITYKSINSIRTYKERGLNVDYVLFEPVKEKLNNVYVSIWRLVDAQTNWVIIQDGEIFKIDQERTIKHTFGTCPARIISDKKHMGKDYRLSFIDSIVELMEEFLRDRSILTISKFKYGFAIPFRPKIICPSCHGTKKNGIEACKSCDGKGFILDADVIDEIIIPVNLNSENQPQLPNNFAGFIVPDLSVWNQYKEEQKMMARDAFEVIWGTRETEQVKDQTAMGVILNTQPMITKLNSVSDVAQSHEQAFTEMMANFHFLAKKSDERVANIYYGRNYIIQPPEFLLQEYQKSNEVGDPITIRDRKLSEYITSKYKNDPEMLRIELLKKDLEPYVHYSIQIVKEIFGVTEAQKKGLFTDWWETLQEPDKYKTKEALEKMRDAWMDEQVQKFVLPLQNGIINP